MQDKTKKTNRPYHKKKTSRPTGRLFNLPNLNAILTYYENKDIETLKKKKKNEEQGTWETQRVYSVNTY